MLALYIISTVLIGLLALVCLQLAIIWFKNNNPLVGIWMLLMVGLNVFNIVRLWM